MFFRKKKSPVPFDPREFDFEFKGYFMEASIMHQVFRKGSYEIDIFDGNRMIIKNSQLLEPKIYDGKFLVEKEGYLLLQQLGIIV